MRHRSPRNSGFIAGRPKAALLFWFFCGLDEACGYLLFFLLDVKNRKLGKNRCLMLAVDHLSLVMSLDFCYLLLKRPYCLVIYFRIKSLKVVICGKYINLNKIIKI